MSMIGESLAHYLVTEKIGAGGMGEVYKATDSRLNRSVAIKILPEEFTHDHDRLARLHREAQVLASLNHPNIAAVYGLEESNGRRALVMELADGDDLSQRLRAGAMPVQQALRIALGVAEALEAAHERGVIHRDLKPANIKVAPDGHVKVLDFGLAKALDPEASSIRDPSHSPTLSLAATRAGLILGTAAYMSPEQASGAPVDKRADIWAFGVVLFEMLAGTRLFQGESVSHTLADVLRSDIDWNRLPQNTPRSIRRLLERCLDRDLKHRLRDVGEARIAIEEELSNLSSSSRVHAAPTTATKKSLAFVPWAVAALAILAAITIVGLSRRSAQTAIPIHLDAQIANGPLFTGVGSSIALSDDGSRLAYVVGDDASGELFVRAMNNLTGTKLAEGRTANQVPYLPFFSPDGQWVGYATPSELRKVPVTGGTPLAIAKVSRSRGATWAADGTIIVAAGSASGLSRGSASGGELTTLTELNKERNETSHRWPQFLPGEDAVLFTSTRNTDANFDAATIEVVRISTGERKVVHTGGSFGRYVPSGHLIYLNNATLFAVPFDPGSLEVRGTPVPVVQGITSQPTEGSGQLTFSGNGLFAYVRGGPLVPEYPVVWVDRSGRIESLISEPGAYANPRVSPDGKRVAFTRLREGNWDIWAYDVVRQVSTRLTFADSTETEQVWSPDGRELIYSSNRTGPDALFRKAADGSGDERQVAKHETPLWAAGWTGGQISYTTVGKNGLDVGAISVDGGKVQPILTAAHDESDGIVSPNGRWLAYTSTESGQPEVYVRPFPSGGGRWQISDGGGAYPRWNTNGQELFYRSSRGIMAAAVEGTDTGFRTERPRVLVSGAFRGGIGGLTILGHTLADYDVSPDGTRFVMFPAGATAAEQRRGVVTFVNPWFAELERAFVSRK